MPTDCQEFEAELSALLDDELSPERAALLRTHIASCERCRAQLAQLARLDSLLAGAPAPAVPASLRARLDVRLAAANGSGPGVRVSVSRAPRRAWRGRSAAAAAAIAAGLALYLAVASREPAPRQGEPMPPRVARPLAEPMPAAPQLAKRDTPARERTPAAPAPVAPLTPRRERVAKSPAAPEPPASRPLLAGPERAAASVDLEAVPDEDLDLALELDTVEDFDEIANLELLELMLAAEAG